MNERKECAIHTHAHSFLCNQIFKGCGVFSLLLTLFSQFHSLLFFSFSAVHIALMITYSQATRYEQIK